MRDTTISRIMDYALATDFAVRAGWRARSGVTNSGTPIGALWAVRVAVGTRIAPRPLHRSRRALLMHRAYMRDRSANLRVRQHVVRQPVSVCGMSKRKLENGGQLAPTKPRVRT